MNRRTVRIRKEARALFWPWCGVVSAAALSVALPRPHGGHLVAACFFMGVPLLATLSLGNEFHHRTFSFWLTQPASRIELWVDKMIVMCPAVLSAGLVSGIVMFAFKWPQLELTYKVGAIVYVLISMASATFWTLSARSTFGGFILIGCVLLVTDLFAGHVTNLPRPGEELRTIPSSNVAVIGIFAFGILFAGLMLWRGARKLARFQVTGGTSGEDLLLAGPSVMPQSLTEYFRCRSSGAFLNLIRKEFRLLRPLWVIALLTLLYLTCLAIFRLLPVPPIAFPETEREWALLGPLEMLWIGMAGLAGILSLGEEKRTGTHAWYMTLPISPRLQWLLKLVVAMCAGFACSLLFPILAMMVGGWLYGSPFMYLHFEVIRADLILFPILTLACFWCACAAHGTVRAAMWAMPAMAAIPFACAGGIRLGGDLGRTTGTLSDFVVSSFHLSPSAFATVTNYARTEVLWLFVPALLLALFQSYRLFRTPPRDGVRWMLRCLFPAAAVTFLWSFSAYAGFASSKWQPFEETRQALDSLQPGRANLVLTGEDLAKRRSLSVPTQSWLAGSSITVAPDRFHSSGYLATIHLAGGLECRLLVAHYGGTAASCASAEEPGKPGEAR